MQVLLTDAPLYLIEPHDIQAASLPAEILPHRLCLQRVLTWARTFLCEPHRDLGREGSVCPYVRESLRHGLFWMAIFSAPNLVPNDAIEVLRRYRDWFLELSQPTQVDAQYKAILVLFPNLLPANFHEIIDATQITLKPEFVRRGLMIGQFHEGCNEPGIWNAGFRPFHSPVPLLAIRHMVCWDAPFLVRDSWALEAYLSRFGGVVPERLRSQVRGAASALGLGQID